MSYYLGENCDSSECYSVLCYGSVKNGFDSAILTKIPKMKEEGLGRRQTSKCGVPKWFRRDHLGSGLYQRATN